MVFDSKYVTRLSDDYKYGMNNLRYYSDMFKSNPSIIDGKNKSRYDFFIKLANKLITCDKKNKPVKVMLLENIRELGGKIVKVAKKMSYIKK